MTPLVRCVNDLRRGDHLLDGALRSFVHQNSVMANALAVDQDDEKKAWLSLELLSCLALEPLHGTAATDFFSVYSNDIGFRLSFYTVTNPVGIFGLPRTHELSRRVVAAIETNLESRMFKVASMLRGSVESWRVLAWKRYEARARAASQRVLAECLGLAPAKHVLSREDRESMDAAYDSVLTPLEEHFQSRVRNLGNVAVPGLDAGWTRWLAGFLYQSLSLTVADPMSV